MRNILDYTNKVIQGDCLEVMKDFPDNSVDMVLCDLPYGTTQNKWDSVIDLKKLWKEYHRVVKDNGAIVLTSQGVFTAKLILSNEKNFKYKIVWIKSKSTNFLNAKKQPLRKHEDICVFYKRQPDYNPQMSEGEAYDKGFRKNQLTGSYGDFKSNHVKSNGERYPTDVVFYEEQDVADYIYVKTAESEGPVYHPTQKPIELGRYLIKTFSKPGDIILDNACGSGSFLLSAILENRQFIGIEKNENVLLHKVKPIDYIQICTNRIEEILKRKEIHAACLSLEGDIYETTFHLDEIEFARMYIYNCFFKKLSPEDKASSKTSHLKTIRCGSKILINKAPGVVIGSGTGSAPEHRALSLAADMFGMDPKDMEKSETGIKNSIVLAIPVITEEVLKDLAACLMEERGRKSEDSIDIPEKAAAEYLKQCIQKSDFLLISSDMYLTNWF